MDKPQQLQPGVSVFDDGNVTHVSIGVGDTAKVAKPSGSNNPLRVTEYNGRYWWSGLGKLHAQNGFPLECGFDEVAKRGGIAAVENAAYELVECGFKDLDTARAFVAKSLNNMTRPIPENWLIPGWAKEG